MIEANRASSSAYEVSMMHAVVGIWDLIVPAHLDAAAVGQADVQDGHVRAQGGNAGQRLGHGAGLADDLEVVGRLEQGA